MFLSLGLDSHFGKKAKIFDTSLILGMGTIWKNPISPRGPNARKEGQPPHCRYLVCKYILSLWMVKNFMGGLSVRDGRLVNERIGDGRTMIQAACEAKKMRKQAEKTAMITNAIVNAKMIEDSMEYGRGMMDMD